MKDIIYSLFPTNNNQVISLIDDRLLIISRYENTQNSKTKFFKKVLGQPLTINHNQRIVLRNVNRLRLV